MDTRQNRYDPLNRYKEEPETSAERIFRRARELFPEGADAALVK